jgi:hypothetical protein
VAESPNLGAGSWAAALQEHNFATIADWFIYYFSWAGAAVLIAAGVAAGLEEGVAARIPNGVEIAGKSVPQVPFIFSLVTGFAAGFRVLALSSLFAAASMVSGWILGLLFGIPRTLARPQPIVPAPGCSNGPPSAPTNQDAATVSSRVNTNLEDISDWLTKMLVGVGLTQLYTVPKFLWITAGKLNAHGLGWEQHGQMLVLGLFFYFAPGGFWLSYVGTRTILTKLFDQIMGPDSQQVMQAADPSQLKIDPSAKGLVAGSEDLAEADRSLLKVPLQSLNTPLQMGAWGAAQARAGNLRLAQTALENAVGIQPYDRGLKEQLAKVYTLLGKRTEADHLVRDYPMTEIAVLNALYEAPPDGFTKAINIGENLLKQGDMQKNVSLCVWLACAYGQQYGYVKAHGASEEELKSIKGKVLQEIAAALSIDPGTRELFRTLWKPPPNSEDNDLASFEPDDPDLKRLLD